MKETVLVIGGCRSGKSSHALKLALECPGSRRLFVATCVPRDPEMQNRVSRHQQERGLSWETLEIPVDLAGAIRRYSPEADVLLIDCLTLWISNLLLETEDPDLLRQSIQGLGQAIQKTECPLILVSNEVGCGIVPENRLARLFRDVVGMANQETAARVRQVVWMVAGIPVRIKG